MLKAIFGGGIDTSKQFTYELDVPAKDGEGKPRRAHILHDRDEGLIDTMDPTVTTLYENFMKGLKITGL